MGITVTWDTEEKVTICYTVTGRWSWNNIYTAVEKVTGILDRISRQVDLIINVREAGQPYSMIWDTRRIAAMAHPRLSMAVIVGKTLLKAVITEAFNSDFSCTPDEFELRHVATPEEAREILDARRPASTFYIPKRNAPAP